PLEDEEAMMPTDLTVPKTLAVRPVGVISACSPFLSLGMSALPTLASTTHECVEMTTICAVVEVSPTLSPAAMLTCATVPAMGEVIVAAARAVPASVSLPCAEASCALAEATCTADDAASC